jgi:16S rRNA G527 N7-methylase RsmG
MTDETTQSDPGAVEAACRRAVASMDELTGIQEPLAESSYVLARTVDSGRARGMGAAAVARELRETLVALKEANVVAGASNELDDFLSSPVVNPAK